MTSHSSPNSRAQTAQDLRSSIVTIFFLSLFAISLLLNVFQGWKIKALQHSRPVAQYQNLEQPTGEILPTFSVKMVSGNDIYLSFLSSKKTVVYIFDPNCHWCARNLSNIRFLASQRSEEFNFVGISRTSVGLKDYLARTKLPFPVYVDSSTDDLKQVGFVGTPQTLVVLQDAKVDQNWAGAYSGDLQSAIEKYFGLKLPGLRPASAT